MKSINTYEADFFKESFVFHQFPFEINYKILVNLPFPDIIACSRVCHFFASLLEVWNWEADVRKTYSLAYTILRPMIGNLPIYQHTPKVWGKIYALLFQTRKLWSKSQSLETHHSIIRHLKLLPDGSLVGAGDEMVQGIKTEGLWSSLYIWPLAQEGTFVSQPSMSLEASSESDKMIEAIIPLTDGTILTAQGNTVNRWCFNKDSFLLLHNYKYATSIATLQVLANQEVVVSTIDHNLYVLSLRDNSSSLLCQHPGENCANFITACGEDCFATASEYCDKIYLWRVNSLSPLQKTFENSGKITCLTYIPKGIIASGSTDGWVHFWDLKECRETLLEIGSCIKCMTAFGEDGLAVGCFDGTVKLCRSDEEQMVLTKQANRIEGIFSSTNGCVIVSDWDKKFSVWSTPFSSWVAQLSKQGE